MMRDRTAKVWGAESGRSDVKCGTCRHMVVKPIEVELAWAAKPISACGPGSHCLGGPVPGHCEAWGRQVQSTQVCSKHAPGGPSTGRRGGANQVAKSFVEGDATWGELGREVFSSGGNLLTFTAIGALAFAGLLERPERWRAGAQRGLPFIEDDAGERYPYERTRGKQKVRILLPMGRVATHRISDLASKDDAQLAAEVESLVLDHYPSE